MRFLALLLLLLTAPLAAQLVAPAAEPNPGSLLYRPPAPPPSVIDDPAAAYITAGQDETGYRAWFAAQPWHATYVKAFNDYLTAYGVADIVPTWELLRTATLWKACGAQPFEIAPSSDWPHVVQTLRYIRDYVVPAIGPVEPVSAYRNPALNRCAGGAIESAHQDFHAIDLVPLRPIARPQLMEALCAAHLRRGGDYQVGLGFYAFVRFHVDSTRFRKWGVSEAADASPCRVVIAATPKPPPVPIKPDGSVVTPTSIPGPIIPSVIIPAVIVPVATSPVDPLAPL